MKRNLTTFLFTLVLGVSAVLVVAAPAHASLSQCAFQNVCIWSNKDYTVLLDFVAPAPGTCYNLAAEDNDRADSFFNNRSDGHHVQFYRDRNCTGGALCGQNSGNVGPFPAGYHDAFIYNSFACGLTVHTNILSSIWINNG